MTADQWIKKLDDEAMNLAANFVAEAKSKSKQRRPTEAAIEGFWVLYYLAHGALVELAKQGDEANV